MEPVINRFESPEIIEENVSSDVVEIAANGISFNNAPLPLKEEPLATPTFPKKVEPLAIDVTMNPFSASTDAETEPLTNIFDSSDTNDVIESCASVESAENGISLNFSPLPLNAEPLSTLTSPKNVEPLSTEVTTSPSSRVTDAVIEPVTISVDNNASLVSADRGISNNPSPLPLNIEPDDNVTSPKKVEPLSIEVTTNPSLGVTEAVTLPLAILNASPVNAERGISNKSAPLPLKVEPLSTLTSPKKVEPLSIEVTTNPSSGVTEAVILPLVINVDKSASSVIADLGMLNKFAPLPLNEPVCNFISPKNVEPLSIEVTTSPSLGETDAVTEPLTITLDNKASCVSAERGISNKSAPLPLNTEPLPNETPPLTKSDELNSALSVPSNLNPKLGSTDAVTDPLVINVDKSASSVIADLGMLNKFAPLPLNEPVCNFISPKNVEPLSIEVTTSPSLGETDAVTEPLTITLDNKASCVSAERGISNKSAPLPLNTEPLPNETPPLTKSDELNSALSVPSNLNPKLGSTDAVTDPLVMNDDNNASGVNAAFGISNRFAPLPLNTLPLPSDIPPLTNNEPVNCEPLSFDITINPVSLSTEALTAPSVILDDCSAAGRLNNWLPSPIKSEDDTIEAVTLVVEISPSTFNEPFIPTEPVNSCKSSGVLPNLFEPDENIIDDDTISTKISLATILSSTYKSPVTLTSPFTSTSPSNDEDTFTKNPVFGAIDADADPLIN